ncbi:hypothetical protein [Pantoea ananatis]|uniref:hypothetical protein n=1 Tax=Pantoea ananas TaxID=553 RepID=UPI000F883F5D|nr:hypothetical protein [Pantoea ananatis]RQN06642.1 hypothetical protein EHQ51_18065 [Pantoea ananatis]
MRKSEDGFGKLRGEQSIVTSFASTDIIFFYDSGGALPVMFLTEQDMIFTLKSMGLNHQSKKLPDTFNGNAKLFEGYCRGEFLSLLYVKAKWGDYRKAITQKNISNKFITDKLATHIHADHVLFRGCLKKEIYLSFNPWLLLIEVPAEANSAFGSLVERNLPHLEIGRTQPVTYLTPLQIFKLICVDMPKNKKHLKIIMKNIKIRLKSNPKLFTEIQYEIKKIEHFLKN